MIEKLSRQVGRLCFLACELALLGILFVVVIEVVARYIFNSPTQSSLEITEYLLVTIGILPLAGILAEKRHVNVDLITSLLSGRTQRILDFICQVIITVFAVVVFYFGFKLAMHAFTSGSKSSSLMAFPLWIAYSVIPIGFFSLALTAFSKCLRLSKNLGHDAGDHS